MSTSVNVYSVPVDRLRGLPGSKDRKLLTALRKDPASFQLLQGLDEDWDEQEQGPRPPSGADAVRQIVRGEPLDEDFGFAYGYAYESLCGWIGTEAEPSWTGIVSSYEWFKKIDATLALLGVRLKVADLCYRGCLIAIPKPSDFPGMGWWTAGEIRSAAEVLRGIDEKTLDAKLKRKVRRVMPAVENIRAWINFATSRAADWLVGIHS